MNASLEFTHIARENTSLIKYEKRQRIKTLINEESLILAKYL